ncbi:aspartate ammonia-lyase [Fictibacillus aquaticus]|uniref:aspartate ammonia-lyase n=2 Tax=Fictibacillus aquaticus TaxID=2021314 RepID=A0A235F6P4_9BACL|nr:aspartate ammonia-lyase [Fictibacillus aquaticus]OYD56355.1 aspartate ammonia-lyase [Fictibacillus aquaticus]
MDNFRIAKDTLGEVKVSKDAYYGAQTQRAVENFPISGQKLPPVFIKAQGIVKYSAAFANMTCGMLDRKKGEAIMAAAMEVIEGKWDNQFVVDAYQAGAGTSQNMNANEVIASIAAEKLGGQKGDWHIVHPNDDVNMAQSTNDTIPTSIYISTAIALHEELIPALEKTIKALRDKEQEFHDVIKAGRTHLQDAVPIRLGSEFAGYRGSLEQMLNQFNAASEELYALGLGGNAVGTGINAHKDYSETAINQIKKVTGLPFFKTEHPYTFMQNPNGAVRVSSVLKETAIYLIKISSDLRLLSSGPQTGLAELILPAVQPGSSIMPGKVNPVILENMYMICSQVIGNDACVVHAAAGSQLEINAMMPVMGLNVLQSIKILSSGLKVFTDKCLIGLDVNRKMTDYWLERSVSLVTALNPHIGYEKAAEVAKESVRTGRTLKEIVIEKGWMTIEEADEILNPANML